MYSKTLQENLLTILVCGNSDVLNLIINSIDLSLFENKYYRRIASVSIDYFTKFKESPKIHITDLLEKEIASEEGNIYHEIIKNIFGSVEYINTNFVVSELEKFIRTQKLKIAVKKAYEEADRGNIDKAENIIENALKVKITQFDVGITFDKIKEILLRTEEDDDENIIYTGIKHLDILGHYPYKKELFILLAQSGYGKSWFLIHLAKFGLLQNKKVLYVTLEIREDRLVKRFIQSLYALTYQNVTDDIILSSFKVDEKGYLLNINQKKIIPNNNINVVLEKLDYFYNTNFIIKGFPSGTLTIKQLKTYLENLKNTIGFKPDILLLDYLDLMKLDIEKLRIDIGRTAVDLRGLADEENIALVTVAQTNRIAENVRLITRKHIADDFSKIRTADIFITYNRTKFEEKYGLARLYVDKSRNNKDGVVVLISQNYNIGQFCLASALIDETYYDKIEEDKL